MASCKTPDRAEMGGGRVGIILPHIIAAEDAAVIFKQMSPADKLRGSGAEPKQRKGPGTGKPRGRL